MANALTAPTIKKGGTDNTYLTEEGVSWVTTLQDMLNKVGNYGLDEDGIFGSKTLNAVKNFQSRAGIAADGVVGDKTWNALYNYWSSGQTPSVVSTGKPIKNGIPPALPVSGLSALLSNLNWTTIGIIAAIGFAIYMMFSKDGLEPERVRPRKKRRR